MGQSQSVKILRRTPFVFEDEYLLPWVSKTIRAILLIIIIIKYLFSVSFASGTSLSQFPKNGVVIYADKLIDQREAVLNGGQKERLEVPVLGLYHPTAINAGRISVFGDSNCLDSAHMEKGLYVVIVIS